MIAKLKELQALGLDAPNGIPTESDVKKLRDLANEIESIALGPVDAEGHIVRKNPKP
jgi:hypothetical protein